jgi:hypothetical protein
LLIFRRGDSVFLPKARAELKLGTGKALTTGKEVRKRVRLVEIIGINFCMGVVWFMVVKRIVGVVGLAFIRVIEDVLIVLIRGGGWFRIRP